MSASMDESVTSQQDSDIADPPYKTLVKGIIAFLNIGMMFFLSVVGALAIASVNDTNSTEATGLIFVGLYLLIFASILFTYEVIQLLPFEALDLFYKKNFGFLYGPVGKGLFVLFSGILAFGAKKPSPLNVVCGVLVCAWGPSLILLYFKFPNYFDKKEKYDYGG